jgi:hypothetical protein
MSFPRDNKDPGTFSSYSTIINVFNSNLSGDTFACRSRHLSLADNPDSAAFHCPHATNPSSEICADSLVNEHTPYELLRMGKSTRHRVGYCDVAGGETIADCTDVGLNDGNFIQALSYLPATVEVIFMSGNTGITKLTSAAFSGNENLQAIYLNDCGITSIHPYALQGLTDLKIFNVNMNPIASLPEALFQDAVGLLQFEYFTTGQGANTVLTSLPATLFSNTKLIERIVLYGHKRLTSLPANLLDGLAELRAALFVDNGLTSDGIPADLFKDCSSLEYFDFFGNSMNVFDDRWFKDTLWYTNIKRVAMWGQCLTAGPMTINVEAFAGMSSLETAYFHNNGVTIDPQDLNAASFPNFNQLTFTGSSISNFCPPPTDMPTRKPTRKPTKKPVR